MKINMQQEKEKWIDEVLQSTEGMSRAHTPDMRDSILSHIDAADRRTISPASNVMVWRIAAAILLLVAINAISIYSYQSRSSHAQQAMNTRAVATELGLTSGAGADVGSIVFDN